LPIELWVLVVIPFILTLLLYVIFRYYRIKRKKNRLKQSVLSFQQKMDGIDEKIEEAKEERERLLKGMFSKPATWSDDADDKVLVEVSPNDDEYWTVGNRLRRDMPEAYISKLWRIQNRALWTFYTFHKDRFSINGIDHKETEVWHGTSHLDPDVIYNDRQDGFMMQFAQRGFWGRGIYFAEKSSYSHSYAYTPHGDTWQATFMDRPIGQDGEREMFLAKLLVGKATTLAQDKSLIVPPLDPDKPGQRYNTVEGQTGGSKVYIVYENGRAFPNYLVRYYRGTRDHHRTPFETQDEAKKSTGMLAAITPSTSTAGTSDDLESGLASGNVTWEFRDNNGWKPYSDAHQAVLEVAHQRGDTKVQLETNEWRYEVDLVAKTQVNLQHPSHRQRKVQRLVHV
jgi:hypothetical protein